MKTKASIALTLTLVLWNGVGFAAKEEASAADAEKRAKMAEMQKYTAPNENHKVLQPLVGKWKSSVRFWMSPDAPPEVSEGTSENHWIMGGRFVEEDFKGTSMGQPFEGMGITGYDTIRGEYTSLWLDNMATGIMVANAQFDAATSTLNQNGTMSCPLTMEKNRPIRSVWKHVDNDHNTYEAFMKDKDAKEYKAMEIAYERVKEVTPETQSESKF